METTIKSLNPAQQTLVINHMDYAKKQALALLRKEKCLHLLNEDLFSEVYYGLCEAACKFNPNKGAAFTTYSYYYIEKYVEQFIEQQIRHGYTFCSYDSYCDDDKKNEYYHNRFLQILDPYSMDAHACARSNRKYLHVLLRSILTPREYEIICSCYGFDCIEENESKLAKRLGVSHQAINLCKKGAFKKIKACPCISQLFFV